MAKKTIYTDEELHKIGYRVAKIRTDFCDDNNTLFAERLGMSKQTASGLCNGTKSVGKQTIEKILAAFPQVSRSWLVVGEGNMLKGDNSNQTNVGDHNSNSGNITNVDERLLDMLEKNQIERLELLSIIKNLTSK